MAFCKNAVASLSKDFLINVGSSWLDTSRTSLFQLYNIRPSVSFYGSLEHNPLITSQWFQAINKSYKIGKVITAFSSPRLTWQSFIVVNTPDSKSIRQLLAEVTGVNNSRQVDSMRHNYEWFKQLRACQACTQLSRSLCSSNCVVGNAINLTMTLSIVDLFFPVFRGHVLQLNKKKKWLYLFGISSASMNYFSLFGLYFDIWIHPR